MSEAEQCRALTADGERCSRPAQDDGFCHQHDSNNETIDAAEQAEGDGGQNDNNQDGSGEHEEETVSQETEQSEEETESDEGSATDESEQESAEQSNEFDVMDVRGTIEDVASDLVGHPLDGIIEITNEDDDGWLVVVEMVERRSIPDTQDILGQYAVSLDESGNVAGYQLQERYRRGDDREQ